MLHEISTWPQRPLRGSSVLLSSKLGNRESRRSKKSKEMAKTETEKRKPACHHVWMCGRYGREMHIKNASKHEASRRLGLARAGTSGADKCNAGAISKSLQHCFDLVAFPSFCGGQATAPAICTFLLLHFALSKRTPCRDCGQNVNLGD